MNNSITETRQPIYSKLAHVYDTLMSDVDYELWADYIDEIIQMHHPEAAKVLELACGTGSVSISLDELGYYDILATDKSEPMIEKARTKAGESHSEVTFRTMNFLEIDLEETFDVVFMVFDSINYLQNGQEILRLHNQVGRVLKPGGFFIFDFTTPRNSRQAIRFLHRDEGVSPDKNYRFFRNSRFDAKENIHINEFEIEKLSDDRSTVEENFLEIHRQKIYTLDEMTGILDQTDFHIEQMYDGFTFDKAHKKSLRITVAAQWQKTQ